MAVLIATSIIVLMFSGAMMLASRRDIGKTHLTAGEK